VPPMQVSRIFGLSKLGRAARQFAADTYHRSHGNPTRALSSVVWRTQGAALSRLCTHGCKLSLREEVSRRKGNCAHLCACSLFCIFRLTTSRTCDSLPWWCCCGHIVAGGRRGASRRKGKRTGPGYGGM
jgi:hypothetical protein